MNEKIIIKEIIAAGKRLYQRNMLAGGDGNISYRINDKKILITATGVAKGFLKIKDIAIIDIHGKILKGKPSTERLMHLEIYKSCPQAKAVIHAHPTTAIAWSVARPDLKELPGESLAELILNVGCVPVVPFALPGTLEMGVNLQPHLPQNRVMILSRHGALSWGEDLFEALNGMERIEHSSEILFKSQLLGGLNPMSEKIMAELRKMRGAIGSRSS